MRKRRISTILAAGSAAVLMLSGFDSAMTVEQLQEKSEGALAGVTSMQGNLKGIANMILKISDGTEGGESVDVPMGGEFQFDYTLGLEPLLTDVKISYDAEMMGQIFSGSLQMLIRETEDGSGMAYMNMEQNGSGDGWTAAPAQADKVAELKDAIRAGLSGDMSALTDSPLSSDTGVDIAAVNEITQKVKDKVNPLMTITQGGVNGKTGNDLYVLSAELTGDVLSSIITDAMAASGQGPENMSLEMVQAIVGGLNVKLKSEIDSGTYLPTSMEADMSDSDFSALGSVLASSMLGAGSSTSAQIEVQTIKILGSFLFNDPVDLTIPQEALDAAANADSPAAQGGTEPAGTDTADGALDADDGVGDLIGSYLTGGAATGSETVKADTTGTDTAGTDTTGTDTAGTDESEGGAVINPDGSYHLEYQYSPEVLKTADVDQPAGMTLSYGSEDYVSFWDDDYRNKISLSVFSEDTEEETVREELDTSYMDSNSDYSNVQAGEVRQTTLADGRVVYYGTLTYSYGGYDYGATYAAVRGRDSIVSLELEYNDENYVFTEATEEQVKDACGLVHAA